MRIHSFYRHEYLYVPGPVLGTLKWIQYSSHSQLLWLQQVFIAFASPKGEWLSKLLLIHSVGDSSPVFMKAHNQNWCF